MQILPNMGKISFVPVPLLFHSESADGGYLSCVIPDGLPDETDMKVQLLLSSMVISLQTIERDYRDFIKITFKK
jgi:large subunit ribosomal protein L27